MKISASIYSNTEKNLASIIEELDAYKIDYFHIDCLDNPSVFEDIKTVRKISKRPIDLHIITSTPEKFYKLIAEHNIESVTFQHENLINKIQVPDYIKSNLGIAVTTNTNFDVFRNYEKRFSYILFMTTTPGESGGLFDKDTFRKIRQFRATYPEKKIHVDGGINEEISFILRNMGVYLVVSGSYLFKNNYLGSALMQLKSDDIESRYRVKDFMLESDEIPLLKAGKFTFLEMLQSIEQYKMGFTIITNNDGVFEGIISNADMRKGLINNFNDLYNINVDEIVNRNAAYVNENSTISEMLNYIKNLNFPILFLPVVDNKKKVVGTLKFNNLIKGEL